MRGQRTELVLFIAVLLSLALGCKGGGSDSNPGGTTMKIELSSTAFSEGANIPKQYTEDGKDVSPPLRWSDSPPQTKSFALICDDPDAPRGTWVHWVLF